MASMSALEGAGVTSPGEVLQRMETDEVEPCPSLWQWLLQNWILGKKHLHAETVAKDSIDLGAEILTALPPDAVTVHPFHTVAILSLITKTLPGASESTKNLLCALRERCSGSWAPPVEALCKILSATACPQLREELMMHLALALDGQAAGKKPFLAVVKHLGDLTGPGAEVVIDRLFDKNYWDGYSRLLSSPSVKGQRPIQEQLFRAVASMPDKDRPRILPLLLERYFLAEAPEGFKFFARLAGMAEDLELLSRMWEMVSKNHRYRLREDTDGSQRESLKRFMQKCCDKNFPSGITTGLVVDSVSHLEFLLRELWTVDAAGTVEMHLGLMRALLEKGDLLAYFEAFVRNLKSRGVAGLATSERWYKAVSALLVEEEESIRAAVVQQGVEVVRKLTENRGDGGVVERMMGAILEGLRPLEHQVTLVRQLVEDIPQSSCKPLMAAVCAARQRLDGWRLPTEEADREDFDGKIDKLGHSADSLLVGVLASLASSQYDDEIMRKCLVRKLRRHWKTGASEPIWRNDLSPNLHAIVAAAEEDTIMEIADIIVDDDLPFEWRSWPEALSLAVGEKVLQNGGTREVVGKALADSAGTSFVYLSLKPFASEDLPDYLLPLDDGAVPVGRVELLSGINQKDMRSPSPLAPSLRWSEAHQSALADVIASSPMEAAAGACAFMLRSHHQSSAARAKSLQRLIQVPEDWLTQGSLRIPVEELSSTTMTLLAKIFELAGTECREVCQIVVPGERSSVDDEAVARLIGAALTNEIPLEWPPSSGGVSESLLAASLAKESPEVLLHLLGRKDCSAERLFEEVVSVTCHAMSRCQGVWWLPKGLLLSVKEGSPSEGAARPSSVDAAVDKCWAALAKAGERQSPRSGLFDLMVPSLQRESLHSDRSGSRISALLYGIAVTIEEALYHQITERDVEILLAAMATLGDDEFCSERCRVLLSLHHALVPTAAPNGLAVCSLYGAMVRLGIRLLEEDLSKDSSLYGFALLWSVLSSAPPEWLVSTLGLVGVRATSALRSAGKRKRSEEEELSWIPYLARYLEKLKRAVPTPALRKYSPIIAAELISRYWSGNKKQRTAVGGENLADDKVDEVIASSLYPLLCEGSTGTKQHAGEATSYKSDDVLHLFASAGSDSSREKVKRMLQMYNQRFRYKGRV
ncbi:DIS3 mitotic control [Perkinsus olseni]|uniref:DIS3 mitotic control n=1 Tax=Perkinsus olseni TaxID=32597 RepID=A0A7J6MAN2_PEROL|nr:DIS3 mitotic control [Perkinsus olseni]